MFCRKCGVSIPDDSNFCPKCGTKVFVQKSNTIISPMIRPSKTQSTGSIESHHNGDGHLLRYVAMLVGGLVTAEIGYAMWIGSTVHAYLGTKASDYYAAFGQNTPDVSQWAAGIFGAIINIAGAICLYIAVCPLARRFGAWRKQNKVIGTILAVVICLAVFVCFSLKTSATGSFGVLDYLIIVAIFGGMWRGGKQSDETREAGAANVTHAFWFCKDNSRRGVFLVAGVIFSIIVVGLLLGVTSTRNERDCISQSQSHTKPRSPSAGLKTAQVTKKSRPSNDVGKKPKTIVQPRAEKEFKGTAKHKILEEVRQNSANRVERKGQGHEIYLKEDLSKLSDEELNTCVARLNAKYSRTTTGLLDYSKWSDEDLLLAYRIESEQLNNRPTRKFLAAYKENRYDEASSLMESIDHENVDVQMALCGMHLFGQGVAQNDMEAFKWCRKAAEHGNVHAQSALGMMYQDGIGVTKNELEAVFWCRKAAEQGNLNAQETLRKKGLSW